jgi:hypothetical protein
MGKHNASGLGTAQDSEAQQLDFGGGHAPNDRLVRTVTPGPQARQVPALNAAPIASTPVQEQPEQPGQRTIPQSSSPSVNVGEQVTIGKYGARPESNSGTATLIVKSTGALPGRFVITCAHVLGMQPLGEGQQLSDADAVYSPALSTCCGADCSNPIGQVVAATLQQLPSETIQAKISINGRDFAVDAALIQLAGNASASNKVPEIGVISGIRDLIAEWSLSADSPLSLTPAQQIAVRKFGATTKQTQGTIFDLAMETVQEPGAPATTATVFEIDPVLPAGQQPLVTEYLLDMQKFFENQAITTVAEVATLFTSPAVTAAPGAAPNSLIVQGLDFSQPGDSGAPIVDASGKIVGILTSGTVIPIYVQGQDYPVNVRAGRSQGIFIEAALQKLNVEFLPPGQQAAGAVMAAPGIAIQRGPRQTVDWLALERAREAVDLTGEGARLGMLVRRHFEEIRELVHHRRRVMVTWYRHKGPSFVNAFIRASSQPGWPLPAEIDGAELGDALRAMRDVLMVEGSASLRATIAQEGQVILDLATSAESLDEVLQLWASPAPPGTAPRPVLQIVNERGVPGTTAALVSDADGRRYLLANHHLVFGGGGAPGGRVWALPAQSADPQEAVVIGLARSGNIGRVSFGGEVCFVDCALVELADPAGFPRWLRLVLGDAWPAEAAPADPGIPVVKHGPATGTTRGVILDIEYPDHAVIAGRKWSAPGQLLVGSRDPELIFCAPGDSGAALLDDRGRILGLVWGSNESGQGVACPIGPVLDCLSVTLAPSPTAAGPGPRRTM